MRAVLRPSVVEEGELPKPPSDSVEVADDGADRTPECPRCRIAMTLVAFIARPSWYELFYPGSRHSWVRAWESG